MRRVIAVMATGIALLSCETRQPTAEQSTATIPMGVEPSNSDRTLAPIAPGRIAIAAGLIQFTDTFSAIRQIPRRRSRVATSREWVACFPTMGRCAGKRLYRG